MEGLRSFRVGMVIPPRPKILHMGQKYCTEQWKTEILNMGWQQHSWSIAASQWLPAVLNPVWLLLCGSLCFTILEQFLCFEFPFEKEDKVLASRCKILHWDKPQCVFFFQWWPSKWRWTQFSSTVKFQTNIRTVGNLILCSRRAMSRMMALEKKKLVSSECSSRTSRSYIIHIYTCYFQNSCFTEWHESVDMISCVLDAGFTLASVLKNESVFQQFLIKNLSLSDSIANLLLNTPVSLAEVIYHY